MTGARAPELRRHSGETGKAFRMAAKAAMRRAARIPAEAYAMATGYLCDALDWTNPYGDMDDSRDLDDSCTTQQDRHFSQP
jgi:hypothetical protein